MPTCGLGEALEFVSVQDYRDAISPFVPSPSRFTRYLRFVFDGVSLEGRTVLDVGGGDGIASFFAAAQGAAKVVCLDPGADGSSTAIDDRYRILSERVGGPVTRMVERFQDHDPGEDRYDVVLVHNAINHLDEDACARLPAADAQASYRRIFAALRDLLNPGGHMIVADCGRRNLWGDLHLPNMFAPTIEWSIHQEPGVWDALMVAAGFSPARIRWDAPSKMRGPGQLLFGNRVGAYLTSSHFVMTAQG